MRRSKGCGRGSAAPQGAPLPKAINANVMAVAITPVPISMAAWPILGDIARGTIEAYAQQRASWPAPGLTGG